MLSDADLVERSRRRDAQAFGSLVERHHRLVFGVAFAKCRDATLAEDIAQEAYVVAWSDLGRLRDAERVGSWIAGIARNLAVSAARERARAAELTELVDARTPEDEALEREDRALLHDALEAVPDTHREALVLYYLEGQSVARIAEGLNIREDLVKQRLTRGRNALRDNIAARVETALGRLRPRAGVGAGVAAAISVLDNSEAVGAPGKVIAMASTKKTVAVGAAILAALAIVGGVTVGVRMRVGDAGATRTTEGEPAATAASSVRTPAVPATTSVHAAAAEPNPVPVVAAPSAEDDDVMHALEGKESRRKAQAVPIRRPAGNYEVHSVEGFTIVHLGSGAPTTKPFGGPGDDPRRTITGRVTDRAGKPVANAIVLADRGFNINDRNDVMTIGGAISDEAGQFSVEAWGDESYALALVRDDWSEIVRAGDQPVELRILGHGSLSGRFIYDGAPETFSIHAAMHGTPFVGRWKTGRDGKLMIPSLPPGRYTVTVGLAQAMFGGASRSLTRDVTIADGKAADIELAFVAGTSLVVTARPPANSRPRGITYWLFTRSAPRDGADARTRKKAEDAESMTYSSKDRPAEFHDVAPGTYYACAGFFDVATMDALDRPFGCTKVRIEDSDSDSVREAEVVLVE